MTTDMKRLIQAEDLYRIQFVSNSRISPDGSRVVFSVQWVDKETEKKHTNLWLALTATGEVRQMTFGRQTDRDPQWSPDGSQIAFISNRDDDKQEQIYLLSIAGGEARPLTEMVGSFAQYAWSPLGDRLVCQFRKKDQAVLDREADPRQKELGVVVRQIDSLFFQADGQGFLPDEKWHLWLVDAENGAAEQLTSGDRYDEQSPNWSPDGKQIAFLSNRTPDPDLDPDNISIFMIPTDEIQDEHSWRCFDAPIGDKHQLSFSPNGRWLAYLGREGRGDWWKNGSLWVVPVAENDSARNLTGDHDLHVGNNTVGDVSDRPTVAPVWSAASDRLYCQVTEPGCTTLRTVDANSGEFGPGLSTVGVVGSFSLDQANQFIAYIQASFADPGNIWLYDRTTGESRQLTHFNEDWLADLELSLPEEVWISGPDQNQLQGWILKPPYFDPAQRYPSILQIHGGPWLQYGRLFMHEFYYLAAQGYVVYFSNPRGSRGYGEDHCAAINYAWGQADYGDIMAWVDYLADQPYIDPDRMGVTGGSYGGYMTIWLIGHTQRFKSAVAQRVVSNTISFVGSSDFNWLFHDVWANGKPPWEDFEGYWRQSPMAYIGNATTPTLIIHSENDKRCNPEQSFQVFVALKKLGVDTELLLFPEESHELSRSGRTDRRIKRLEHIARWFDRYLKEAD